MAGATTAEVRPRSRLTDPDAGDDRREPLTRSPAGMTYGRIYRGQGTEHRRHQQWQLLRQEISDPRTRSVVASSFVKSQRLLHCSCSAACLLLRFYISSVSLLVHLSFIILLVIITARSELRKVLFLAL